jgi:hypothetical protein
MLEQENPTQALKLLEMGYGNQVTEEKLGRMFLVENQKSEKVYRSTGNYVKFTNNENLGPYSYVSAAFGSSLTSTPIVKDLILADDNSTDNGGVPKVLQVQQTMLVQD